MNTTKEIIKKALKFIMWIILIVFVWMAGYTVGHFNGYNEAFDDMNRAVRESHNPFDQNQLRRIKYLTNMDHVL